MKTLIILVFLLAVVVDTNAQVTTPSAEIQINTAVLAAPEDMRDEASIYGYDVDGAFVLLREGSNNLICLADDPSKDGFNVSCYHRDLEPFMARGRALKLEGKSFQEINTIREEEAENGKLKMPEAPSSLTVFYAPAEDFDATTGEVTDGHFRYVIYIPQATAESTGLPLRPEVPGMPWLMDPGMHRAHIMITPPTD